MSWSYSLTYKGLRIAVESESVGSGVPGEVVGVFIRDENTIQAIRSHDSRILEMLEFMVSEIDVLSLSMDADGHAFGKWRKENNLDEYEQLLFRILNGKYADDVVKENVRKELEWVVQARQDRAQVEAKRLHSQRRRTQFSGNYDQLMLTLIQRDGYKCAACGTVEDLTIDHIVPLSKGGSDDVANLQLLCRIHNSSKGDR